jgi:hypothetical protein
MISHGELSTTATLVRAEMVGTKALHERRAIARQSYRVNNYAFVTMKLGAVQRKAPLRRKLTRLVHAI